MWAKIKKFFAGSETIAWARTQSALGFLAIVLTYVDPAVMSPLLGDVSWFPYLVLANGIATEYLRRRRATDL